MFTKTTNTVSKKVLNEATRKDLLINSKGGKKYKHKQGNRWDAKKQSSIANTVKDYNKIDMNTFWKKDVLNLDIKIKGETDDYVVTVEFANILTRIKNKVVQNRNILTIKTIYDSLVEALNSSDVRINCSCPDFKYRFKVWATKNKYNAGEAENREAKITNPNNDLGTACKHILNVLNNAKWIKQTSSVINNYVNYCKDNMEYNYSRFIFPKIYGITYDKAVQLTLDDYDENGELKDTLSSDEKVINLANALGKVRGRIKKGQNKNPVAQANKDKK